MTRSKLTVWDVDEDMHLWLDVLTVYEQIEVDKMLDAGVVLLNSYKMMRDLYGEDSKQAKEWLENLLEYMEGLRG
jgi:hypothetical protein